MSKEPERGSSRSSAKGISKAVCPFIVVLVASVLTIAPLHIAGSPSTFHGTIRVEPIHTTSSAIRGTILSLGPETFTHNTTKVSVILACTNADLIEYNIDLVGTGASDGWYGGGERRQMGGRTDGITQILRTICLICACHLMGFLICYHSHKLQMAQASFTGHSCR